MAAIVLAAGSWYTAQAALVNGDMEYTGSYSVCPGWTYYSQGTISGVSQGKEATIIHGGLASQRLSGNSGANARMGIRQTVAGNVGDAFTFDGWVYTSAAASTTYYRIAARWDGSTANPDEITASFSAFAPTRTAWNHLTGPAGNATTAAGVTVFLDHTRRSNAAFGGYWDDITVYQAYVPPLPTLTNPQPTSIDVDVDPGLNSGNLAAEYAISIGGGAYTLGTDWLQADGSIAATQVWQTDAVWGTLTANLGGDPANYQIGAMARYSGTITQPTYLDIVPEPATLGFLALGALAMLRRRR
jgi:hypothetical protein